MDKFKIYSLSLPRRRIVVYFSCMVSFSPRNNIRGFFIKFNFGNVSKVFKKYYVCVNKTNKMKKKDLGFIEESRDNWPSDYSWYDRIHEPREERVQLKPAVIGYVVICVIIFLIIKIFGL